MTLVKSDIPRLLEAGLKTVFFEAYDASRSDYERIVTVVSSEQDAETYAWLGSVPKMREFKDERMPAGLLEHEYTIRNRTWEASIAVDRAAVEDDLYGQIKLRVQGLAHEAHRHLDEIVFSLLSDGFTTICHDGQFFFDTDHSEGESGTQSNKGTSALGTGSLEQAITAMMRFKDDNGKPLGIVPDTLVVPPDLQWTALELLNSNYYPELIASASGSQKLSANPLKGRLDLVVSPYLADTNNWFLLATKWVVRPIILQMRVPVEFSALEGASESGFMRDRYVYGVRARYNVGFGLWQTAYGALVG
jgi:phage major head subunit gpT-like protein